MAERRQERIQGSPPPNAQEIRVASGLGSSAKREEVSMNGSSVELADVVKLYNGVPAVRGVSLRIGAGEYCCLLGPSGCGKTSTLRMIAGHEAIDGGEIRVGGTRVNDLAPSHRGTAMMFQSYALFPHLTVLDNVAFALVIAGKPKAQRIEASMRLIEMVGLSGWERHFPHQLSGGQAQRAALARALNARPRVLLLDEPLSALDPLLRIQMRSELKRMQAELGLTFIHVTHSQEEAMALSDHMVVMEGGHVRQSGSPGEVFERPASAFVADFIGGHALFRGQVRGPGQVGLADGSRITALTTGLAAGEPVDVAVRSDLMTFEAPPEPANSLTAEVRTVEPLGPLVRVTLRLASGEGFSATLPARQFDIGAIALNQRTSVYWPQEVTKIYPQDQHVAAAA